MGRIGYLNVLPIYHPLEAGIIPHDFELVSGPPALLNTMEIFCTSLACPRQEAAVAMRKKRKNEPPPLPY